MADNKALQGGVLSATTLFNTVAYFPNLLAGKYLRRSKIIKPIAPNEIPQTHIVPYFNYNNRGDLEILLASGDVER